MRLEEVYLITFKSAYLVVWLWREIFFGTKINYEYYVTSIMQIFYIYYNII